MFYAVTIRSPVSRGVLRGLECPELPEPYSLITAGHIPGKNGLSDFPVPVLAETEVQYIGEPVAILAGPEERVLEEYALKIKIIAEEKAPQPQPEIIVERGITFGQPEEAFARGETVVEGTYITGTQAHWYPEPHGAAAVPSPPPHGLTIHTATQWPGHVKRSVERVLGWRSGTVTVNPAPLAAHLDGKIWYPSLVACHAALAAVVTGNPVKLMLTGEEDFLYAPKRNRARIEIRSALGEKGEIAGSELRLRLDLGAYGVFQDEIIDHTCLGALGLYQHRSFKIDGAGICSNIPVQGPLAGFGLAQGFFAAERHASRIAGALGQDPAQWRKDNVLKERQSLAIGTSPIHSAPLPELIDAAAAFSGYYRKWASYELLKNSRREKPSPLSGEPLRGIGIATACQGSGFLHNNESGCGNCSVEARLEKDGSLEIRTGFPPSDVWRELASGILGVEEELIRLPAATDGSPDSGVAALSRNIGVVTRLVEKCCTAIRSQRFRRPLPITVKRSAKSPKEPAWGGAVPKSIESDAFSRPSWAAAVAEIEIDPVSLWPVVRGIWLVADAGKILSQRRARSSLRTGIIQALGWTCREQLYYEGGKIPPGMYRSYDITSPAQAPPIHVDFIWNDSSDPGGIGDLPFFCVPAAYAQAVSQAMDHHFDEIPLDAARIWDAAKRERSGGAL